MRLNSLQYLQANDNSIHTSMNSSHYDSKSFQGGQINQQNQAKVPSHSTHYSQQHDPKNQHQANSMVNQMNSVPVQQQMMNTQQFGLNNANNIGHASVVAKHHVYSKPAQQTNQQIMSNQMSHYNHSGNHVAVLRNQPYPSTSHLTAPSIGKLIFFPNIM